MKTRLIYAIFALSMGSILFTSNASGPAANGNGGQTGAPGEGTCLGCHPGGTAGNGFPVITIQMLNGASPITSYTPGQNYTLRVQVSGAAGSLTHYWAQQSVILKTSDFTNAGTLSSPITNSHLTTTGGRTYFEHSVRSSTGIFTATWQAPAAGTGTVRIYTGGMMVVVGGGNTPTNDSLTLNEANAPATISYTQATYCNDATNPSPTITGTTGGTFSSTAGLSINNTTGQIDLAASTTGTYTVTYTYSGFATTTTTLTINPRDVATINYSNTTYCQTAANPSPAITGTTGGSFSSTAGLFINSTTGQIDLAASTTGSYSVIYTTSGTCPTMDTFNIAIQTCSGIDKTRSTNPISVYPNPNNGQFNVYYETIASKLWLEIVNMYGQTVYRQQFATSAENIYSVDLGMIPAGAYFLRLPQNKDINFSQTIIISQ